MVEVGKKHCKTCLFTGHTCRQRDARFNFQTPLADQFDCATNVCELGKGTNRQSDWRPPPRIKRGRKVSPELSKIGLLLSESVRKTLHRTYKWNVPSTPPRQERMNGRNYFSLRRVKRRRWWSRLSVAFHQFEAGICCSNLSSNCPVTHTNPPFGSASGDACRWYTHFLFYKGTIKYGQWNKDKEISKLKRIRIPVMPLNEVKLWKINQFPLFP